MGIRTSIAPLAGILLVLAGCSSGSPTDTPGASPSVPSPGGWKDPEIVRIYPVGAEALETAPDSKDAAGNPVSYDVSNVLDGDPTTAWRVAGDGIGTDIVLNLGGSFFVYDVCLIPGYAKVDPSDGTDRFLQNRRITQVVWDFADAPSSIQWFVDPPSPSMTCWYVGVASNWVRLRIDRTTEDGGQDFTAISDIEIHGFAEGPSGSPTDTPGASPSVPSPGAERWKDPEIVRIYPVGAEALETAPDSKDAAGNPVSYDVSNVLDGDPTTAWRVAGDGIGTEIVLDLGGSFWVIDVCLIPGYAKVDAKDGTDRFLQNRRITQAVWEFADVPSSTQWLGNSPSPSMTCFSVGRYSNWVRLRIARTTEDGGRDYAAISDIEIRGYAGGPSGSPRDTPRDPQPVPSPRADGWTPRWP